MARGYLIFIVLAGIFSAIAGGGISPPASSVTPVSSSIASEDDGDDGEVDREDSAEDGTVELERSADGHFYADVEINGSAIRALVDTGATAIALSRDDARRAGLAVSIGMTDVIGRGASGDVHGEYVKLDRVTLGHRTAEEMDAVVLDAGDVTLLGQDFLSKFDTVRIEGDRMLLQ